MRLKKLVYSMIGIFFFVFTVILISGWNPISSDQKKKNLAEGDNYSTNEQKKVTMSPADKMAKAMYEGDLFTAEKLAKSENRKLSNEELLTLRENALGWNFRRLAVKIDERLPASLRTTKEEKVSISYSPGLD